MATTQYIGSRYVPLFADPAEWNNTRAYEPLTIVLHEGNSYTSKQYVPVGTDISNEEFWAKTGNYNAQVEQYRQEVMTFDARIKQTASDIESETNRAETVEKSLAVSKSVMLSFGDSFGDESGEWPFLLASKFGLTCDSFNIGGDVWPWTNGLNKAIAKYNTDEMKNKISFAIAYGGINQIIDSPLTDPSVIKTFIDNFNAAFPGVTLYIAPMNNCSPGNTNFPNIYANALKSYVALMGKLRQLDGNFILLNNSVWYNTGMLNLWKDDKLHPNAQGSIIIANNIAMAINGTNTNIQLTPVFGEHDGWDILTDCYVTGDYLVTPSAVNTKVTTTAIYTYTYGIVPLSLKNNHHAKIPCDVYNNSGVFKGRQYVTYEADSNGLQNLINNSGLSYDETDTVYIRPTFIPLFG